MVIDEHPVHSITRNFLHTLNDIDPRLPYKVIIEEKTLDGSDVGSKPEEFTIENLIRPILKEGFNLSYKGEPYRRDTSKWPDFEIDLPVDFIGESKSINNYDQAIDDIKNYIRESGRSDTFGLATDGLNWSVHQKSLGSTDKKHIERGQVSLKPLLLYHGADLNIFSDRVITNPEELKKEADSAIESLEEFFQFENSPGKSTGEINSLYKEYSNLIFGDTGIVNSITTSESVTESQKEEFAVNFANRILFIKYLEDTEVIETGFLDARIREIENSQTIGSLYDSTIKPIFKELLDTPEPDRKTNLQKMPFSEVPYVNGGLFNIKEYESKIDIPDFLVKKTIDSLETGRDRDKFDPEVMGDIFEQLTNNLSNEKSRSDSGTYYTPDDLTTHIIEETVHPKIKEILAKNYSDSEEQRGMLLEQDYTELVDHIRYGTGLFTSKKSADDTISDIKSLNIADIACGSGHFLTALMEELSELVILLDKITQEQNSLSEQQIFEHRKDIASGCLYGVDISGIAIEIAKFRIWFKLIEDLDWSEIDSTLPNIDLNIKQGNSLLGLPFKSMSGDKIREPEIDLDELEQYKNEYIAGNVIGKKKFNEKMTKENKRLNEKFYEKLNKKQKLSSITSADDWKKFKDSTEKNLESDSTLHEVVEYIKLKRPNGKELTDYHKKTLSDKGYTVNKKSARLNISNRDIQQKNSSKIKVLTEELVILENAGLIIDTVKRRLTQYDVNLASDELFHWPLHFPEIAEYNSGRYTVSFDIIVGNPPYGNNILSDSEKKLLTSYDVNGINEIAGYFIERQKNLVDDDNLIGNVLPGSILVNKNTHVVRNYIEKQINQSKLAFYGTAPSKVFPSVDKRVITLFTNSDRDKSSGIHTSDLIRFTKDQRGSVFDNTTYKPTKNLQLNETYLPKVGDQNKMYILNRLLTYNTVSDYLSNTDQFTLDYRKSGRYWLQALNKFPYDNTKITDISFSTKLERDTTKLIFNSTLFYMFWTTYGNGRDLNDSLVKSMPLPDKNKLLENKQEITLIASELEDQLLSVFDEEEKEFKPRRIRRFINYVDRFICELYDFDENHTQYIVDYHRHIRS